MILQNCQITAYIGKEVYVGGKCKTIGQAAKGLLDQALELYEYIYRSLGHNRTYI